MGAFSSTEAYELPDLTINVDLEEDATIPTFETPGRGGLTLYARNDVVIEPNKLTKVPTGVIPRMPFMLIGIITPLPGGLNVQTQVVDYDTSDPIEVSILHSGDQSVVSESGGDCPPAMICAGCPVAMLVMTPIARPSLRVSRPDRDDDDGDGAVTGKDAVNAPVVGVCVDDAYNGVP
jgi:dUTPase